MARHVWKLWKESERGCLITCVNWQAPGQELILGERVEAGRGGMQAHLEINANEQGGSSKSSAM